MSVDFAESFAQKLWFYTSLFDKDPVMYYTSYEKQSFLLTLRCMRVQGEQVQLRLRTSAIEADIANLTFQKK